MAHRKRALTTLFDKIYKNKASRQEKKLADRWYSQLDLKGGIVFPDKDAEEQVRLRMLANLHEHIFQEKNTPGVRYLPVWKRNIAAAIIFGMLSFGSYTIYRLQVSTEIFTVRSNSQSIKKVTLPDGTLVTLNKLAQLSWTSDFGKKARKVTLSGEAFFDVKKDTEHPFILQSDNITTTVLGTAFNVESYRNENQIKVSLVRGHVRINDRNNPKNHAELDPGQMISYNKERHLLEVKPIAVADPSAWINGGLVFNEIPLAAALNRLSAKYHMVIKYDAQQLLGKNVTASFESVSLDEALSAILFMHNLKFTKKKGEIIID